jgi:hypothetical protein
MPPIDSNDGRLHTKRAKEQECKYEHPHPHTQPRQCTKPHAETCRWKMQGPHPLITQIQKPEHISKRVGTPQDKGKNHRWEAMTNRELQPREVRLEKQLCLCVWIVESSILGELDRQSLGELSQHNILPVPNRNRRKLFRGREDLQQMLDLRSCRKGSRKQLDRCVVDVIVPADNSNSPRLATTPTSTHTAHKAEGEAYAAMIPKLSGETSTSSSMAMHLDCSRSASVSSTSSDRCSDRCRCEVPCRP